MKMFGNKSLITVMSALALVFALGLSSCGDDDKDNAAPSYRYLKIVMNGNSDNDGSHLTEVSLLNGSTIVSVDTSKVSLTGFDNKTSVAPELSIVQILFDGEEADGGETWAGISTSTTLEIDLGQAYEFTNVKLGAFVNSLTDNTRVYSDVEVSISGDGSNYTSLGTKDVLSSETF